MEDTDNAKLCVLRSPEKMLIREADKYSFLYSIFSLKKKKGDVMMSVIY